MRRRMCSYFYMARGRSTLQYSDMRTFLDAAKLGLAKPTHADRRPRCDDVNPRPRVMSSTTDRQIKRTTACLVQYPLVIMTKQDFVGNQPVEQIPGDAKQKIPDEDLMKEDIKRLSKKDHEPGASVRAGVATRDPNEFDSRSGNERGNSKPVTEVM